ncbi:MAG: glutathione S-transferase family protein [Myxococcales bacterium]|nr:glutathione S-transferase family protein [Myxococcales bacterium]
MAASTATDNTAIDTPATGNTVKLYTNPQSRGQIAHWMLEETGVPYEVELLDLSRGEHKTPDYLRINPMGKVPAIVHRGVVVTECAAICAYLADAFPEAGLAPAIDDPARGTYYRWLFFAAGPVEMAVTDKSLGRTAERPGMLGYGTYKDTLDTLEAALARGPWLLGDRFSAADVYVGAHIGWGLYFGGIEKRDVFVAYHERLNARPAAKRSAEANAKLEERLKG